MARTQLDSVCPPPAGQCSRIAMEERTPLTATHSTEHNSSAYPNGATPSNSLFPDSEERKTSAFSSKKVSFAELPDKVNEVMKSDSSGRCCVIQ